MTPHAHASIQPPRSMEFALFLTGGLWVLAARTASDHAASGLALRFRLETFQPLLAAGFLLFLLLAGFAAIAWIATRQDNLRSVNALPSRPSTRREWSLGAAIGWGMLVLALAPMLVARDLTPTFWLQPRAFGLTALSLLTLLVFSLALEVAFRGYVFARLIRAIGPTAATLLLSCLYASVSAFHPNSTRLSVLIAFFLGILFSLAYLRTHALWLGWGLHFGWVAAMGALFGLPVGGVDIYSGVVDTTVDGADWVTGALYGPEGATLTLLIVALGAVVLYVLTRDLAWEHTHTPIVAAGYVVEVAPPAQHTAMENAAAAAPVPLVQILTATPTAASTMPVVSEHLAALSTPPPQDPE